MSRSFYQLLACGPKCLGDTGSTPLIYPLTGVVHNTL